MIVLRVGGGSSLVYGIIWEKFLSWKYRVVGKGNFKCGERVRDDREGGGVFRIFC